MAGINPTSKSDGATEMPHRLGYRVSAAPSAVEPVSVSERVWSAFKTFLWVAPITALIWIYAEREQIGQQPDVRVQIVAKSNASDRIVTLLSPEDRFVEVDLTGPRASLDLVRVRLAEGKRPLEIAVSELPGFEGEIAAIERLGGNDIFKENAIQVKRVRPSVRVRVEAKGTRQIPIRVRSEEKNLGKVVFDPETITIDGPKAYLDILSADDAVAYADLSRFVGRKPDTYEDTVPVIFSAASEHVSYPKSVKVKVTILRLSEPYQIQSMPVLVLIPSRVLETDKFKVQAQSTLANVNVAGPPEAIQLIKDAKFAPSVVVELSPADLVTAGEKTVKIKAEHYRMPKDVSVQNPDREITVTLSERGG